LRRTELIACVVLAGCMKIYPDPELPDAEISWYDGDCREETGDVVVALVGVDDTSLRSELVAPCTDARVTFVDVLRQRFRVEGTLKTTGGDVFTTAEGEIDLRNGFDVETSLYFGGFDNFRASWMFDVGHTCESLGAFDILIELSLPGGQPAYGASGYCQLGALTARMPPGTYTARAIAFSAQDQEPVAISPSSPELMLTATGFSDAGTFVLSPCGTDCE
jgi:hypothetical protein